MLSVPRLRLPRAPDQPCAMVQARPVLNRAASAPALPDLLGAMIDRRWSERFKLTTFPLAMNRNDRGELTENDCPECEAAKQHLHVLSLKAPCLN